MNPDMSDLAIQREITERFAGKYAGMSLSEWRHMIENYTRMARLKAQDDINGGNENDYLMAAEPNY